MKNPPGDDPAKLLASLEEMVQAYRRLHRLSEKQRKLIEGGEVTTLMALLETRQRTVERLGEMQPDLQRAVESWRSSGKSMPEPFRSRIRQHLEEIDRILKEVMAADAEDARLLGIRRDLVRGRLERCQKVERAAEAYRATADRAQPHRLDLKEPSP